MFVSCSCLSGVSRCRRLTPLACKPLVVAVNLIRSCQLSCQLSQRVLIEPQSPWRLRLRSGTGRRPHLRLSRRTPG